MPIILVVDDSSTDRQLIGGLLQQENPDWLVEYAVDGAEALRYVDETFPDVVVTDLMMPEMSGIELVTNVRRDYPHTPVVLTTAHGSEELAIEALERGAASYVPKTQLSEKLVETIKQVLELANSNQNYKRLIECLNETQFRFFLENDPALIPPTINLVQEMMLGMKLCDRTGQRRIGIALDEALLNAIYHGNLEMPRENLQSVRTSLHQGVVPKLVQQRRLLPVYSDRSVFVEIDITADQARFVVRDEGPGFDPSSIPEDHDASVIDEKGGRGLVLMKNLMDEVEFNDKGNQVTMVKYKESGNGKAME